MVSKAPHKSANGPTCLLAGAPSHMTGPQPSSVSSHWPSLGPEATAGLQGDQLELQMTRAWERGRLGKVPLITALSAHDRLRQMSGHGPLIELTQQEVHFVSNRLVQCSRACCDRVSFPCSCWNTRDSYVLLHSRGLLSRCGKVEIRLDSSPDCSVEVLTVLRCC
jgi:hypothetical protein